MKLIARWESYLHHYELGPHSVVVSIKILKILLVELWKGPLGC